MKVWWSDVIAVNADECLMTKMQEMSLGYHFTVEQEVGSSTYAFFGFNGNPDSQKRATVLWTEIFNNFVVWIVSKLDSKCERVSLRPIYLRRSRTVHPHVWTDESYWSSLTFTVRIDSEQQIARYPNSGFISFLNWCRDGWCVENFSAQWGRRMEGPHDSGGYGFGRPS